MLVNENSAAWYYNQFFSSFSVAEAVTAKPIWQIYFRRDYSEDAPAEAILPTAAAPQMSHVPGATGKQGNVTAEAIGRAFPFGLINEMLFSLASVSWSSRYGGSVALEFQQATFAGSNEPHLAHDNFEFEVLRIVGDDEYLFDLDHVSMRIYVNPNANALNPRSNRSYSMPAFVEFRVGRSAAYKNGTSVPNSSVEQLLRETLDSAAARVASKLGGDNRSPAGLFTLAFIHDQFQNLIGVNEKVTRLYLSDDWLDLVTEVYQPYIFSSIEITKIYTLGPAQGFLEGEPEWKVVTRVYETGRGGEEHRLSRHSEIIGNDEATEEVSLGAFGGQECGQVDHVRVRFDVTEVDPLSADDEVGGTSRRFLWNCELIEAQMAQAFYTGFVQHGLLPAVSGTLLPCRGEVTPADAQIDRSDYCEDGEYLRGYSRFDVPPSRGFSVAFPRSDRPLPNRADDTAPQPAYVWVSWRARVGIGVR